MTAAIASVFVNELIRKNRKRNPTFRPDFFILLPFLEWYICKEKGRVFVLLDIQFFADVFGYGVLMHEDVVGLVLHESFADIPYSFIV